MASDPSAAQPPRTTGMSGVPNSPTSTSGAGGGGSAATTEPRERLSIERRIEMRKAIELRRNGTGNLVICSTDELEALLDAYESGGPHARAEYRHLFGRLYWRLSK